MAQGSLRDLLNKKGSNIPPSLRLSLAKDTAQGMQVIKKGERIIDQLE